MNADVHGQLPADLARGRHRLQAWTKDELSKSGPQVIRLVRLIGRSTRLDLERQDRNIVLRAL